MSSARKIRARMEYMQLLQQRDESAEGRLLTELQSNAADIIKAVTLSRAQGLFALQAWEILETALASVSRTRDRLRDVLPQESQPLQSVLPGIYQRATCDVEECVLAVQRQAAQADLDPEVVNAMCLRVLLGELMSFAACVVQEAQMLTKPGTNRVWYGSELFKRCIRVAVISDVIRQRMVQLRDAGAEIVQPTRRTRKLREFTWE